MSFATVLHELGANASKYGAWSNRTGRVDMHWTVEPGETATLLLNWSELAGPPVGMPKRQGFGSRLVFEPRGVVCTVRAPLSPADAAVTDGLAS